MEFDRWAHSYDEHGRRHACMAVARGMDDPAGAHQPGWSGPAR
jgi:hypothetical protein